MKVGGQILWNVIPICETSQTCCLMGRRPMKDVLGNHIMDRLFHSVHWLSITLSLPRTSQESINLERKSYLDCSSDTHYTRWERWKGDILVADIEELETMDASEIYSQRLNAKEVIFPKEEFIFPIADGRIKPLGGDQELRTSTLIRQRPIRGESHLDILGESEGSLPQPHDSFPDVGGAINDLCSMSGSFIERHHVEPRVKLYSPREESFPIPLKYIDVSRTIHTNLDVKLEKRIDDYWNIDGSRDLSDPWTGFTHFTLLDEKAPDGYMCSGWRLTTKQLTSRPDHLWPELWKSMGKNAKLNEKQKWSNEKPKFDNARRIRGIYFTDPEDKEFTETIKSARKKLETPLAPALLCKTSKKSKHGETRGKTNEFKSKTCVHLGSQWIHKTAHGRISTELSWGSYCRKRVTSHCNSTIWYTNLFLCIKPWRFPQQKQQWIKNGRRGPAESQK